jgi:hypothetical protein
LKVDGFEKYTRSIDILRLQPAVEFFVLRNLLGRSRHPVTERRAI